MTSQLQGALDKAIHLPVEQQNALAAMLLQEIESEQEGHESFVRSVDVLDRIAEEALEEDRRGQTADLADLFRSDRYSLTSYRRAARRRLRLVLDRFS